MAPAARSRCLRNWKPHPCGHYGDLKRECRCTQRQIQGYRNRISGPLLDRIDIHIEVPSMGYAELSELNPGEPSAEMRRRIVVARGVQQRRYATLSRVHSNADMAPKHMQVYCRLRGDAQALLKSAIAELNLSARAYDRILRVSRTIADLDGSQDISPEHISEAIQYRTLDRQMWA